MPNPLHFVPLDVPNLILDEIFALEDRATIDACSVVWRSFTNRCQKHLFRKVLRSGERTFGTFGQDLAWVVTHTRLAGYVEEFTFAGSYSLNTRRGEGTGLGELNSTLVLAYMSLFPKLKALTICSCRWIGDDRAPIPAPRCLWREVPPKFPNLKTLIIDDVHCLGLHSNVLEVFQFVVALDQLRIARVRWQAEFPERDYQRLALTSKSFALNNPLLHAQYNGYASRIRTVEGVEHLHLEKHVYAQAGLLRRILSDNNASLKSLSMTISAMHDIGPQEDWDNLNLSQCTSLTWIIINLQLHEHTVDEGAAERAMALSLLLLQLPDSLQHLTLHITILNDTCMDAYDDLQLVDWAAVGIYVREISSLSQISIQLHSVTRVNTPHWTEMKRTEFQDHLIGFSCREGSEPSIIIYDRRNE
ncbi:hypothetical protein EIP86_000126 [Pleurotus ostreatoroseus]|nr:hypothetical protein EIP86_000126 [Pleurotus ostreatoroseus]